MGAERDRMPEEDNQLLAPGHAGIDEVALKRQLPPTCGQCPAAGFGNREFDARLGLWCCVSQIARPNTTFRILSKPIFFHAPDRDAFFDFQFP